MQLENKANENETIFSRPIIRRTIELCFIFYFLSLLG